MTFTLAYLVSLSPLDVILDRLNKKSKKDPCGCCFYTGSLDRCGYGLYKIGRHNLGAHKVSYIANKGDYDQDNLELLHSCDNPSCINPEHLKPGTHRENMQDCIKKGRHTFQKRSEIASTRKVAIANKDSTYIGSVCQKHMSNVRITRNGQCIECYELYKQSIRSKK